MVAKSDDTLAERLATLSPAVQAEVEQLSRDGYLVHKVWANGVELRKGPPVSDAKFALHLLLLILVPALPFVARSSIAGLLGYRHRVFVSLDGTLHFV